MTNIARKGDRKELPVRREPHWYRLEPGAYLGFRRGPDTWIARFRDRGGKQNYAALSIPHDAKDEFVAAKKLAEAWFAQMGGVLSASAKRGTVTDAFKAYVENLRRHGRGEAATVANRYIKVILAETDPLAGMRLEDATREDFENWRTRLLPGRHVRSVNRYSGMLAAGLNASLELGFVGDARAWSLRTLTDDSEHDEQTAVFLTPEQRQALLKHAAPAAADFFRGLSFLGCRPGELARARVSDFDGEQIRLTHRKGRPPKLRVRYTVLSADGIKFFSAAAQSKSSDSVLLADHDGNEWTRQAWGEAMRKAVAAYHKDCKPDARLPDGTSAYAFRHSRISELLQLHGIDPLTVAMQTGTSLLQIEKTYFKFIPSALKAKLAAVREAS